MPTNVTAEYKKHEAEYRKAREPQERLKCLKEMLRTIPKHKGTEHLQADIKTRIKQLTEEVSGPKKGGAKTGPSQTVKPDGAAQVALLGPPNAGKSSFLAKATGAQTDIGPYPFTTQFPIPGMFPFEDIYFQLVDLPPISADFMEPWMINSLQTADAALLVIDLAEAGCTEHVEVLLKRLEEKKVTLTPNWPSLGFPPENDEKEEELDPFRLYLPTALIANKGDLQQNDEEIETLKELLEITFPSLTISAKTGQGLEEVSRFLFQSLGVVRVYTKAPGKKPEMDTPYTLPMGSTVMDLAQRIHKDFAKNLKFAKIWGSGRFDGQQVGGEHQVVDRDVLEIHI